jgi:hypothetical protein
MTYLKGKAATAARSRRASLSSVCLLRWMGKEAGSQSMWPSRRPMREMKPGEGAGGAGGREGGREEGVRGG